MLAEHRQHELRKLLETSATVSVRELAQQWNVSEMTVRRDLKRLEDEGVLTRVHGGAVARESLRFLSRRDRHRKPKRTAAEKLLRFVPEVGCIYLDGSTTIHHLVSHLDQRPGLLVATNNIDTFQELSALVGTEAVLIGGRFHRSTDNFVGPVARRALAALAFDVALFSCFALDPAVGPCEPEADDAEIKQEVCARAARHCLAVNQHKLGGRAASTWSPDEERAVLATDLGPRRRELTPYRDRFATIL